MSGSGKWVRESLAVLEVAISLVLLIGAGLLLQTFVNLTGVQPGFDPHNVLTMMMSVDDERVQISREVVVGSNGIPLSDPVPQEQLVGDSISQQRFLMSRLRCSPGWQCFLARSVFTASFPMAWRNEHASSAFEAPSAQHAATSYDW